MKKQVQSAKSDIQNEKRKGCLCCIPSEVLLIILGHLSVFDYPSIRAVCKCWRAAFLELEFPSTITRNDGRRQPPWFLLLRADGRLTQFEKPPLYTTGKLGDLSTQRIHTINAPELWGTRFLMSRHGWLLLFSSKSPSSLFFLNPFSRARINLPFMDVSKLTSPVFDISAPPTSPECTAFVISYAGKYGAEISICRRGESAWTTRVFGSKHILFGHVVNTVFVKGVFYCIHDTGMISVFDTAGDIEWRELGLPKGMCEWSYWQVVSYVMKHGDQVGLYFHAGRTYEIDLAVNGSRYEMFGDTESLLRFSSKEAILQLQDRLKVDSFNLQAWCATFDSENEISFHWHNFKSFVDRLSENKNAKRCRIDICCVTGRDKSKPGRDCTMVAWVEPTWVHCSPNLDWTFG